MTASPATPVLRRLGVALLTLGALALAPGRASATCGDYLTKRHGTPADHATTPSGTDHRLPNLPCHGPDCSNLPTTPLVPPPLVVNVLPDVKGRLTDADDSDATRSRERLHPLSCRIPVDRPTSIFHPPRV